MAADQVRDRDKVHHRVRSSKTFIGLGAFTCACGLQTRIIQGLTLRSGPQDRVSIARGKPRAEVGASHVVAHARDGRYAASSA
jgi:hypothetical protein